MTSKTIFITGASSGIGKATAKFFQEKGWNVVATMRKPENEEELNQLENVMVAKVDVTDKASMEPALSAAIEKFGSIDVLLNNAGYGAYGPLEAFPSENIDRQFNTNVNGLIHMTKAVLPYMRKKRSGIIINVSSVGGKVAFPLGSLYHGTKFAVEGFSEALHYELEPIGIKVKLVEPGGIKTDFSGRSFDFANDESLEEYQSMVGQLLQLFSTMGENLSPVSVVAEAIWEAATDGKNTLRYIAGEDAKMYIANRKTQTDEEFTAGLKQAFGFN